MADLKNYNGENIEGLLLATTTSPGLLCAEDKAKVDTVKAIAAIAVGDTVVEAQDTVDTLSLASGTNVVLQPDPDNKKIVIDSENTTYDLTTSKSSTNGNVKLNLVPSSGTTDTISIKGTGATSVTTDANGVVTVSSTNTTYAVATTSANGLMSSTDKSKLDGIAANANKYTHPTYTAKSAGLYKVTVDGTGHVSAATAVAKADITALGIPAQDTTYSVMGAATSSAAGKAGLVPAPAAGKQNSFLRGDGTWVVPTNTTYGDMAGATTDAAGSHGLVPAPAKGSANRYLRSDATWQVPPNTTYSAATTSANGLMSSTDKSKLDGIAANANNYSHPTYTARSAGFYKVTVDGTGHVSAVTAVAKADITALGIPAQDTTYSVMGAATSSAAGKAGLVPAPAAGKQASFLRGDGTWVVPTNTTYSNMTAATTDTAGKAGLVPAPAAGAATRYLRSDATWQVPPNTTYSAATTSAAGLMSASDKSKLDGITASADAVSFSRSLTSGTKVGTLTINGTGTDLYAPTNTDTHYASGTIVNNSATATSNTTAALTNGNVYLNHVENGAVKNSHKISGSGATSVTSDSSGNIVVSSTNTTYGVATTSANGLMSSTDKSKLDGIATGANKYTHPTYTAKSSGLYKVTVDSTGHVSAATAVAKADITALGIPAQDTTYSAATTSANGLMSSSDKSKLNGITAGANKVTITDDGNGNVTINIT